MQGSGGIGEFVDVDFISAYLTRAVSVRLATVIITGGVLKPTLAQALAVSRQS